jgi:ATP-dependent DNA helicase DinG
LSSENLTEASLAAFDNMVAATAGFRARPGQRDMAWCIANALSGVVLGSDPEPDKAITVIQAGTGVGKSAAYLATTVAMALSRKTRVLISTATVALQEQLMNKDLPALAAVLEAPFAFALAKGRGRYVCKFKLESLVGPGGNEFFEADDDTPEPRAALARAWQGSSPQVRRMKLYDSLASALASRKWNGDRDQLAEQPDVRDWSAIAAERHTCTARHCPRYQGCSYYRARIQLTQADVIVANHDLVLASLGMKTLPELDNCLVVFDEGHHLPAVALNQFASSMDLSTLRWLDKLPRILLEVSEKINMALTQDVATLAQQLKGAMLDMGRLAIDLLAGASAESELIYRFKNGLLPESLMAPLTLIQGHGVGLSSALEALGSELKKRAKEDPAQAVSSAMMYARLGQMAPRLGSVLLTTRLLLDHDDTQPLAKWLRADASSGLVFLSANACPIVPGDLLRQSLWAQVRGAVITSATLTSCGNFDYFLQESGLEGNPAASTLEVSSPFNYATQGRLIVVETLANPKDVETFTHEMISELLGDLHQIERGALALFTSRVQMKAALEAIDTDLQAVVLVQGQMARGRLLERHQARIEAGHASIIFGLQSFGEGLDLPGKLCETVFIAKLPFSSPSDPVDQARAEWLQSVGRDPFTELVVPATGIKLLQWTGRAIRTEADQASVICYDRRLLQTSYGKRLLKGLPPYALWRRVAGVLLPV